MTDLLRALAAPDFGAGWQVGFVMGWALGAGFAGLLVGGRKVATEGHKP